MTVTESMEIYPQPKKFEMRKGRAALSADFELRVQGERAESISAQVRLEQRLRAAVERLTDAESSFGISASAATNVDVIHDPALHPQGYRLSWDGGALTVASSEAQGLHYAVVTLEQMMARHGAVWDGYLIEDEPDFPVRGLMLDIGRNKIPKTDILRGLIDTLSELKMNHLQLYIEGFSFDYPSYRESFPEATPITAEEFRELDLYAKERFVDLVPNQNCFGHMGPWLAKPEFRELAEHPDGMPTPLSFKLPPLTLDPTDERSIALVRKMFDELLPHFSSGYANVNMDEPFGLGTGRSKPRADEIGVGRVYLEFAEKVFEAVRKHGKQILMWGDIVTKHEEIIPLLPKDVTVLDWNYESHTSFEAHCKLLSENGVPFYVCPGTSAWSAITGRTDNMLANIEDAARNGLSFGAGGLIVTDWGDSGHWQPLVASYPAYAYAAGSSWGVLNNADRHDAMEQYVSDCMLRDRKDIAGGLLLELGRYNRLEQSTLENMTYASYLLNRGLSTRVKLEEETDQIIRLFAQIGGRGIPFKLDYRYEEMLAWLERREEELSRLKPDLSDGDIVVEELANALRLIRQGAGLHRFIFRIDLPDARSELAWLRALRGELSTAIEEFKRLWLLRNREGGLSASTSNLYRLLGQYEDEIRALEEQVEQSSRPE